MKYFLRFLLVLLLFAAGAAAYGYHEWQQMILPADIEGKREPQVVEIKDGVTATQIGEQLEQEGLIRSALAFRLLIRFGERPVSLKTGHFMISPSDTPQAIIAQLDEGAVLTRKLTIPEGLLIHEIAQIIDKNKICDSAEFVKLATAKGKDFGDFPANLTGYLLPDTYQLPWTCTAQELVTIMTSRFDELARPTVDAKSPLPLAQTIVLASLIEREARVDSERPIIASVYINRLNIGMLLQCDATIQYALGKQKEVLLYKDLEIDSPYNTYRFPGLPPGPICNPGLAAIKAAAHPQKTDYLFYVRNDIKGDGSHVFTTNETEHNRAVSKYLR